jgi:hypothetical protein
LTTPCAIWRIAAGNYGFCLAHKNPARLWRLHNAQQAARCFEFSGRQMVARAAPSTTVTE